MELEKVNNHENELSYVTKINKKAPIFWQRLSNGILIRDLQEEHFEPVLKLIKDHFVDHDEVMRNLEINASKESVKAFLQRVKFHLINCSSLLAINEVTNEVAGVVILREISMVNYARSFCRPELFDERSLKNYAIVKSSLFRKMDLYEFFECEVFLMFYMFCVLPKYRQKGLGFDLLNSALDVARSRNISIFLGIVTNHKVFNLAQKVDMQILFEIDYSDYEDEDGKFLVRDLKNKNYLMLLMVLKVFPFPLRPLPISTEKAGKGKGKGKGKEKEKGKGKKKK